MELCLDTDSGLNQADHHCRGSWPETFFALEIILTTCIQRAINRAAVQDRLPSLRACARPLPERASHSLPAIHFAAATRPRTAIYTTRCPLFQ